jgi:hypothetical protein
VPANRVRSPDCPNHHRWIDSLPGERAWDLKNKKNWIRFVRACVCASCVCFVCVLCVYMCVCPRVK